MSAKLLSGTTHNEAYHKELKAFFRNVMKQSAAHARMIADVATIVKLIALMMQKAEVSREHRQVDLLLAFAREFSSSGFVFPEPLVF